MAKVTSKLQVTIPKALAEKFGIEPGDEIQWTASGDGIRVTHGRATPKITIEQRLEQFDRATARQLWLRGSSGPIRDDLILGRGLREVLRTAGPTRAAPVGHSSTARSRRSLAGRPVGRTEAQPADAFLGSPLDARGGASISFAHARYDR